MTLDPNWFYSTLAQSAAAIVGIVGSVLVVRLQSQLEIARRNKEQLLRAFLECRGRWISYTAQMTSIIQYVQKTTPLVTQALGKGVNQLTVTEEVTFGGSRGGSPWQMQIGPDTIGKFQKTQATAEEIAKVLSDLSRVKDLERLEMQSRAAQALGLTAPPDSRNIVDPVLNDLKRLIEPISRHQADTTTRTSIILTGVLAWLCVFGLLFPLTFLSAHAETHKYWLTIAFAVAVLALPAVLALQVHEVRAAAKLVLAPENALP